MGLIGGLNQAVQGNVISPVEYNQNMDSIRDTFNTFAVLTDVAKTITVQHTFNPIAAGAPFLLGANALNQLVTGLNSDRLDSQEGAFYRDASNLDAGTVPSARIAGAYTGITLLGTINPPVPGAPFTLGANALGQLVTGLNADLLDSQEGAFYRDAGNLNAGTIASARVAGDYTGITAVGTLTTLLHLNVNANEQLRLNTQSATGEPMLTFYQDGTRRSYIQHVDSGDDLRLVSEFGEITMWPGAAGTEVETLVLTTSSPVLQLNVPIGVNDAIRVRHADVDGSPFISFYQTATRRAYIEWNDTNTRLNIDAEEAGATTHFLIGGATRLIVNSAGINLNGWHIDNADEINGISLHLGGRRINDFLYGTTTVDPASLAAGATTTTDITVSGAAVGDFVITRFQRQNTDIGIVARSHVVGVDTVRVYITNASTAAIDIGSGTFDVLVIKHQA